MVLSIFRQEAPPPPPPPIVINKYSDEQLRAVIKRMRDRLEIYKEKAVDQYASSPEISPPVSESKHRIICLQLPSVYAMCNLLILIVGALTGQLYCSFSTSVTQRRVHKSHWGEEKASGGGEDKEGGGWQEEKRGAGEEKEGGRGEEERGGGEKVSGGEEGEKKHRVQVERDLLVFGGCCAETNRGPDGLCAGGHHRPLHWPPLHRLAQPGDSGLQLQHLVHHSPPVLPVPHRERHLFLVCTGHAGWPYLPDGLHHLPAPQTVRESRRHHRKSWMSIKIWKSDVVSQNGNWCFVLFRKRERWQRRTTEIRRDSRYINLNFVKIRSWSELNSVS